MGFLRSLAMIFLAYLAFHFLKRLALLALRPPQMFRDKETNQSVALDARPCPKCGRYTTERCDQPDCAL